jgi:hypothetical protein
MLTLGVTLAFAWLDVARGADGLLGASLERSQLAPECAGRRPVPQFGRDAAAASPAWLRGGTGRATVPAPAPRGVTWTSKSSAC